MSLSYNIKQFRQAQGISQEYMTERLCMHQSTYSRIERRDSTCAQWLPKIAEVLQTTPDVLQPLGGTIVGITVEAYKKSPRQSGETVIEIASPDCGLNIGY